jgi:hypothetical protein
MGSTIRRVQQAAQHPGRFLGHLHSLGEQITGRFVVGLVGDLECQSALKIDPLSARKIDPPLGAEGGYPGSPADVSP